MFSPMAKPVSLYYTIYQLTLVLTTVFSFGTTKDQRRKRQFTISVKTRQIYLRELKINKALVIDIETQCYGVIA